MAVTRPAVGEKPRLMQPRGIEHKQVDVANYAYRKIVCRPQYPLEKGTLSENFRALTERREFTGRFIPSRCLKL